MVDTCGGGLSISTQARGWTKWFGRTDSVVSQETIVVLRVPWPKYQLVTVEGRQGLIPQCPAGGRGCERYVKSRGHKEALNNRTNGSKQSLGPLFARRNSRWVAKASTPPLACALAEQALWSPRGT